jgi:hypothetical protein
MSLQRPLQSLSDDDLLASLADLLRQSRRVEAPLVAHIAEVQARRLYARFACTSMFKYCTDVLHLSECEAYYRIAVARATLEHPVLREMLSDGRLHLTAIACLAPHLTTENRDAVLARAVHKSKREIEELVAELAPRPDVPSVMRKLPDRSVVASRSEEVTVPLFDVVSDAGSLPRPDPAVPEASVPRPDRVSDHAVVSRGAEAPPRPFPPPPFQPLAPARYKVQFTAGVELRDKLERLRALLRSEVPDGDLGLVVEKAVDVMLERIDARKFGRTRSPRTKPRRSNPASRDVTAEVQRVVYERDGGQCRYVDEEGRRCPERHHLEYHHRNPYARRGGKDPENICLMCHAHNWYLAELAYGKEVMDRYRRLIARRRAGTLSGQSPSRTKRRPPSPAVDVVRASTGETVESNASRVRTRE